MSDEKICLKETLLFERSFEDIKPLVFTAVAYLISVSRYLNLFDM